MKYKNEIVVNIYDLREALILQYGEGFGYTIDKFGLQKIMFGCFYIDDSYYMKFYLDKCESDDPILRSIVTFLKDIFPDKEYILVNVDW